MKRLLFFMFIIAIMSLASCSNSHVQVEYMDGKIENLTNPEDMTVKFGDTVIVEYYSSNRVFNVTTSLYGFYRGDVPPSYHDTIGTIIYYKAVVVKP